jgi:hypothetical protein
MAATTKTEIRSETYERASAAWAANPYPNHYPKEAATMSTYTVTRVVTGHSYARNGNLDRPTERVRWEVRRDGRLIGTVSTRRKADDLVRLDEAEQKVAR